MNEREPRYDLAVVGAGPCGLGVAVAAKAAGLRCVTFDKRCIVSGIAGYPTYTTFFSTAERLEIGGVPFTVAGEKPTRREALAYYRRVAQVHDLDVRQYEEVTSVARNGAAFRLRARRNDGGSGEHEAGAVVVATGYFDSPNLLGIPGEDLPKVAHRFTEGHPYFRQECVVVGGGNSAAEAALDLHRAGARVTLVHFLGEPDPGVKPWVRPDLVNRLQAGGIAARWHSRLVEVRPDSVVIASELNGEREILPNDWVFAMTGYTPRPALLQSLGVRFDEETGVPVHDPETMETAVPGLFVAGVVTQGDAANRTFIENGREHGPRIVRALKRGAPARIHRVDDG